VKNIHIKKITEINKDKLVEFYKKSLQFENGVIENFNWRYRLGFNDYEPLVLIINNEICGHAGLIPTKIKINNMIHNAIWFTDFFINKNYRSKGYGKLLTEEWMKICPIQITLCNEDSLRIFRKYDWVNNKKFIRKIKFSNYLNILPKFKNINYSNNYENVENLQYLELDNSIISKIIEVSDHNQIQQPFGILRDEHWFKWRLIDCPYKKDIHILKIRDQYLVTHLRFKKNLKILNIIYSTSDITSETINILLKFLKKNKIDLFAFISNKKRFFDNLIPGQKNLNFAFYSKDKNILNNLNKDFDDIQYIDSDLDYIV